MIWRPMYQVVEAVYGILTELCHFYIGILICIGICNIMYIDASSLPAPDVSTDSGCIGNSERTMSFLYITIMTYKYVISY